MIELSLSVLYFPFSEATPKRSLGGLTPAAYAQRLMQNPLN